MFLQSSRPAPPVSSIDPCSFSLNAVTCLIASRFIFVLFQFKRIWSIYLFMYIIMARSKFTAADVSGRLKSFPLAKQRNKPAVNYILPTQTWISWKNKYFSIFYKSREIRDLSPLKPWCISGAGCKVCSVGESNVVSTQHPKHEGNGMFKFMNTQFIIIKFYRNIRKGCHRKNVCVVLLGKTQLRGHTRRNVRSHHVERWGRLGRKVRTPR